jgi:hypothetical protein
MSNVYCMTVHPIFDSGAKNVLGFPYHSRSILVFWQREEPPALD